VTLTNEDLNLWGWENSVVIPNAQTFDCDIPSCLQNKQVIAVGRYTYQKGFDMLIDAWKYVVLKNREWKLIIVGEGELRDELKAQINNANVQDYVKFLPATNNIQEIYRESSILVMSSRYEGFGMVLLEAHTMGVPTISFDCKCGPSEIINHGKDGFLIKEGDVQDMSEKLLLLMENDDLRKEFGNKAFKNAKRYSENLIMHKWVELFKQVTRNV
jgi:glycosyltransferase involved in cell wall biosynthesis